VCPWSRLHNERSRLLVPPYLDVGHRVEYNVNVLVDNADQRVARDVDVRGNDSAVVGVCDADDESVVHGILNGAEAQCVHHFMVAGEVEHAAISRDSGAENHRACDCLRGVIPRAGRVVTAGPNEACEVVGPVDRIRRGEEPVMAEIVAYGIIQLPCDVFKRLVCVEDNSCPGAITLSNGNPLGVCKQEAAFGIPERVNIPQGDVARGGLPHIGGGERRQSFVCSSFDYPQIEIRGKAEDDVSGVNCAVLRVDVEVSEVDLLARDTSVRNIRGIKPELKRPEQHGVPVVSPAIWPAACLYSVDVKKRARAFAGSQGGSYIISHYIAHSEMG